MSETSELTFPEMRAMISDAKRNGFDEAVFAGRNQMKTIVAWAYLNERVTSLDAPIEGEHRPEVGGLPIYLVNAEDYWRVS